jgi:spore germination protein YaaH
MTKRALAIIILITLSFSFSVVTKGASLRYAGWLPYWKKQSGAQDTAIHLDALREISPFSYEVNKNGTLKDALKIHKGFWPVWISAVQDLGIKIIPTIAWFDGNAIHDLLSKTKSRIAHEDAITKLVLDENFDGIDIDYESKLAKTNPYFSLFIKGLAIRLHPKNKILSCTVEARTPLASLENSDKPEKKPSYANDYAVLNKYCDEIRIMAYDQGLIDLKLNAQKGNGDFYAPVADPDWVEKVIKEATKTISKKKIMLGIPTYGYEYEVSWKDGITTYRRIRSVNFFTAMNLADSLNATPERNSAGELSFVYPTSTSLKVSSSLISDVSSTLPKAFSLSANLLSGVTRFVSFSDAESVDDKIQLAKKYGLRGVVFFKLDGEADPLFWEKMK